MSSTRTASTAAARRRVVVRPAVAGPSAALFALWLLYLAVAEAADLYSTFKLAVESGVGWRGEWNPLLAAIWRADGPGGLIVAKLASTLVGVVGCALIYRLGWRRWATALAAAYVVAYMGLTLWHVWQIAHLIVLLPPR